MISTVVFDVGETLVDETRHWGEWADWLDVPRLTMFAALGVVIERRQHHHRAFDLVRPGIDLAAETARRRAAGWTYGLARTDFYPDALPCLTALKAAGYRIGVAGNQPEEAEAALAAADVKADFVASSARWGVEKPAAAFFEKLARAAGVDPAAIAYVGDRVDNDVVPAKRAGMLAIFIRRGPWGIAQASWPEAAQADIRLETLAELAGALKQASRARSRDNGA
ncbi:MAG: HAD family hydrolase [Caulobacterales bacterium]